jgi:formate dehydrogenase major subunit
VSAELAQERGLTNGDWATIVSPRSAIEARVLVTDRVRPLTVGGRTVHQIGLPYHWGVGRDAVVEGDAANDLLGVVLDPNVHIQESKVGSCDIQPGRRPRGEALLRLVAEYQSRAGSTAATGNDRLDEVPKEMAALRADSAPPPADPPDGTEGDG